MKDMAYITNPRIEQVRYEAYKLVHFKDWSTREVARHLGYSQSAIVKWSKRKPAYGKYGRLVILTRSSRPRSHPRQLSAEIVSRILKLRAERNQCAEILHHKLQKEGVEVSLSSIKRVLKRNGCSKYSQWKKWHQYPERPMPEKPGVLVQLDTIVDGVPEDRLYVYTMLDVCSRWGYALPISKINTHASWKFVYRAKTELPFNIQMLQSDHGAEFSKWFTKQCTAKGLSHRHSRVRRPTDNAHLERFNRTLQEECLSRTIRSLRNWRKVIPEYIHYYNTERPHMGLDMKTPLEVITSY